MNDHRCPSEAELVSFVDADLPPEQLARVEKHLELCGSCAKRAMALSILMQDVAAPLPQPALDVGEHWAGIMKRLDAPARASQKSRLWAWSGGLAVAAAALLSFAKLRAPSPSAVDAARPAELTARGGPTSASLSRNVGVQLYAQRAALEALATGSRVAQSTPFTAGLRNLASERAYLLLFAIDARNTVHWISPEYTSVGQDPAATPIAPAPSERLLPSVAVFDDLALGPLRVVAIISRSPMHVSDVEALPPSALSAEKLLERLPGAEIRQFLLEVQAD